MFRKSQVETQPNPKKTQSGLRVPAILKIVMLLAVIFDCRASASNSGNNNYYDDLTSQQQKEALAAMGSIEAVNACGKFAVASGACQVMAALPPQMRTGELASDCSNKQMFFNQMTPEQQAACLKKLSFGEPYLQVSNNPTFDPSVTIPLRRK
jgi:hypothetical protein